MPGNGAPPKSPDFTSPPLTEVVCGLQFAPIPGWTTAHYGLFWSRIKAKYPSSEDQAPLPRVKLEELESPLEFSVAILPPLRRVFYCTEPANYLLQVQPNRFLHNWRKLKESDDYPRFPDAYLRFTERWSDFRSFLGDSELAPPTVQLFELTYANVIGRRGAIFPRDVWQYMNFYKELPQTASGADPRALGLSISWPLEEKAGRLTMKLKHGIRTTEPREQAEPVMIVEFTALGMADKGGDDMERWFKAAHDAIVYTFAALTTEDAHKTWGRIA
jgi:uncharacterized protein (TIGR04255 family)